MQIRDSIIIAPLFTAADRLKLKLPADVVKARARTEAMSTGARDLAPGQGALADAVAQALGDGKDPAADLQVTRILNAAALANEGVRSGVEAVAYGELRAVLTDQRDAIVDALRVPFDKAAADMSKAHEHIGNRSLDNTAAIVARGGDAADAWALAQGGVAAMGILDQAWSALAGFVQTAPKKQHAMLRVAAIGYDTWSAEQLANHAADGWRAVCIGVTPSLPTLGEYASRIAELNAQHRARQDAAERVLDGERSNIAGRPIYVGQSGA